MLSGDPEREEFAVEVRHLIYFSHRVIFHIQQGTKRVVVYRIYHGRRKRIDRII